MKAVVTRLAAVAASFIVANLTTWGFLEITPELSASLEAWLNHTFELLLLIGYAIVHPWLERRLNPPATRPNPSGGAALSGLRSPGEP